MSGNAAICLRQNRRLLVLDKVTKNHYRFVHFASKNGDFWHFLEKFRQRSTKTSGNAVRTRCLNDSGAIISGLYPMLQFEKWSKWVKNLTFLVRFGILKFPILFAHFWFKMALSAVGACRLTFLNYDLAQSWFKKIVFKG